MKDGKSKMYNTWQSVKGYLHYKMETSQNVSFEAEDEFFFYFVEKLCSVLKIFKFSYF